MPELPEVESFARSLQTAFSGKVLRSFSLHRKDLRFPLNQAALSKIFAPGRALLSISRIGKQLELRTCHPSPVHVSLGMSGAFLPAVANKPRTHEHITLTFITGEAIAFVDPRRFGFWQTPGDPYFNNVGVGADPLNASALNAALNEFRERASERSLKDVLMDQSRIEGIGNIYALEALFRCGLHPTLPICRTSKQQLKKLAQCIPPLLEAAIESGGSTIKTYRTLHGASGQAQELHQVYGRDGKACLKRGCGGVVQRVVQGGRGSWFCEKCQPVKPFV